MKSLRSFTRRTFLGGSAKAAGLASLGVGFSALPAASAPPANTATVVADTDLPGIPAGSVCSIDLDDFDVPDGTPCAMIDHDCGAGIIVRAVRRSISQDALSIAHRTRLGLARNDPNAGPFPWSGIALSRVAVLGRVVAVDGRPFPQQAEDHA